MPKRSIRVACPSEARAWRMYEAVSRVGTAHHLSGVCQSVGWALPTNCLGCVTQTNIDISVRHTRRVGSQPHAGRVRARTAVQVELPVMPRTGDDATGNLTGGEIAAGMRAAIIDDDESIRIGQVENGKITIAGVDKAGGIGWCLGDRQESNPGFVGHDDQGTGLRIRRRKVGAASLSTSLRIAKNTLVDQSITQREVRRVRWVCVSRAMSSSSIRVS